MQTQYKYGYQSKRTCTIETHKYEQILQICTYDKCDKFSRWACAECIKKNLHSHSNNEQVYLNSQNQYLSFLHQKRIDLNKHRDQLDNQIQRNCSQLKDLIGQMFLLQDLLPNIEIIRIQNNNIQRIEMMISHVNQDFFQISSEQIKRIENIDNNEIVFELKQLNELQQNIQVLLNQFKELNEQLIKKQGKDTVLNQNQGYNLEHNRLSNHILYVSAQEVGKYQSPFANLTGREQDQRTSQCFSNSEIPYLRQSPNMNQNIHQEKKDPIPQPQNLNHSFNKYIKMISILLNSNNPLQSKIQKLAVIQGSVEVQQTQQDTYKRQSDNRYQNQQNLIRTPNYLVLNILKIQLQQKTFSLDGQQG